jgi:hypothetical protein
MLAGIQLWVGRVKKLCPPLISVAKRAKQVRILLRLYIERRDAGASKATFPRRSVGTINSHF